MMKRSCATAMKSALLPALLLLAMLTPGWGETQLDPNVICSDAAGYLKDADGDGLLNGEECQGLSTGSTGNGAFLDWPGWLSTSPVPGKPKLNPAKRDILMVLVRANPTNIPTTNTFEYIATDQPRGLGTNVYEITGADVQTVLNNDRRIVSRADGTFQKAVKMQESRIASQVLGKCDEAWATPNGLDNCWVFTEAIKTHIKTVCAKVTDAKCLDSTTKKTPLTGLNDLYIKHTIAHECGHDVKLRGIYVSKTGGYHYAATDNVILSQSVYYKAAKSLVTWYIGTSYYSPNDQRDFVLYESE